MPPPPVSRERAAGPGRGVRPSRGLSGARPGLQNDGTVVYGLTLNKSGSAPLRRSIHP